MKIQAYLFFDGRCEEAIDFYREALGAEVEMLMRIKDSPEPPPADRLAPGNEDKIMHAAFRIGDTMVMASDGACGGDASFKGFALSLSVASATNADRVFTALATGGRVDMPLSQTFWSSCFGMLTDQFGISWMVSVAP